MLMWRSSGARRVGLRGMDSLIERDASALAILTCSAPIVKQSLTRQLWAESGLCRLIQTTKDAKNYMGKSTEILRLTWTSQDHFFNSCQPAIITRVSWHLMDCSLSVLDFV